MDLLNDISKKMDSILRKSKQDALQELRDMLV